MHRKAYHYGKQLVPVSTENEHVLKLGGTGSTEKQDKSSQSGTPTPKPEDMQMKDGNERQFKMLGFTNS